MERILEFMLIGHGACMCFYSGDTQKLKDDLAKVKPTIFVSVPRLFNRMYDVIKEKMEKTQGIKGKLASVAYN